jgi:hypothetical protein
LYESFELFPQLALALFSNRNLTTPNPFSSSSTNPDKQTQPNQPNTAAIMFRSIATTAARNARLFSTAPTLRKSALDSAKEVCNSPIRHSHCFRTLANHLLEQTAKSVDQTLSAKAVSGIEKGEELAQKAKEAAGMSAAEAESKAKEVAGQAQGKAQELKGKAQGTAAELEGQAKSTAAQAEGKAKSTAAQADAKAKANGL